MAMTRQNTLQQLQTLTSQVAQAGQRARCPAAQRHLMQAAALLSAAAESLDAAETAEARQGDSAGDRPDRGDRTDRDDDRLHV